MALDVHKLLCRLMITGLVVSRSLGMPLVGLPVSLPCLFEIDNKLTLIAGFHGSSERSERSPWRLIEPAPALHAVTLVACVPNLQLMSTTRAP